MHLPEPSASPGEPSSPAVGVTPARTAKLPAGLLWAGLLALVALLPFLHKPYNIDDVTFLLQAQHMLHDPLHPTAFDMVFGGTLVRVSRGLVSGPVMAILLLPSVAVGGAEWIAHVIQIAILVLGAGATFALALRLGSNRRDAGLAALFVVVSPAVLGMAATAMPDVPAMSFAALGLERLLAWQESRRRTVFAAAVLCLALAVLSRPHTLLVLGVAALLWPDEQAWQQGLRRVIGRSLGALPAVLCTLLLLVLVNRLTRDPQAGRDMAAATLSRISTTWFWYNLATVPAQWTLTFPLVFAWLFASGLAFFRQPAHLILLLLGGILGHKLGMGTLPSLFAKPLGIAITALGTAVLGSILLDGLRRRDRVQVALGLWLLIAVPAAFYDHLPTKYLVPSAPAMAILLVRHFSTHAPGRLRWAALGSAVLGVVISLLVMRADASLAEIGKRGGALVTALRHSNPNAEIWLDGGWGFQWYAMQAGARPMTLFPPLPKAGDLVVSGPQGGRIVVLPRRKLVYFQRFEAKKGWVLGHGAGFFTNGFGPLPWSWGPGELGRLAVWRIE